MCGMRVYEGVCINVCDKERQETEKDRETETERE